MAFKWHLNTWAGISGAVWVMGYVQPIAAQVIPDSTLPAGERSQVSGDPDFQIDGGARRGGNLFHSFSQFSVPTGGSASFNNATDVQNIFSRVTGGSVSNIDGLIQVNGTANLFLLNPNGILFGPNASLNIGGSFVGTTANAIGFANGEVFSSDATQPLPSQLLTINPNALFFSQSTPQPIINQSTFDGVGLQVPLKQNLLLVGGAVQLDNGRLASPGSYVELGSVGGVGTVDLATTAEDWQLRIPDGVARADVSLINNSRINVLGGDGGSIAIAARNLFLNAESRLRVGIDDGLGFVGAQAGGIQIDATETINLTGKSTFRIEVLPGGTGNVGDMTITTGSLVLTEGSRLIAAASGQGDVGSVTINARDRVSLDGGVVTGVVQERAVGNTGDLNITTGSLSLTGGTEVIFNVRGQGNVGSMNIHARDRVSLDDSIVFNTVEPTGVGNAGDINITTESLSLTGAALLTNTSGQGNAGSVTLSAHDRISLDNSYVFNTVEPTGVGNAGAINITTGSLALMNGGQLIAGTSGQGNASNITIHARDRVSLDGQSPDGDIASTIFTSVNPGAIGQGGNVSITTGSLFLTNGGAINTANIGGTGNSGRVTIQARDSVQIRGTAPTLTINRSGVFTSATEESVGDGGDVSITTGSLSVSDRGRIITNAEGQGNAGNIQIQASDRVLLDGGDAISTLDLGAVGRGGDIEIAARSLSLLNGAQLSTSTRGQGNAGNVTVNTRDTVSLAGANRTIPSAITTRVESGAVGDGGQIEITTGSVSLTNGAQLATTTFSRGQAGDISINARDRVAISGSDPNYANRVPSVDNEISAISAGPTSGLFANTEPNSVGRGGDIRVVTGQLTVGNGARLVASTAGQGGAGNIRVRATEAVTLSGTSPNGFSSGLLTNTEATAADQGGEIRVDTPTLQVREGAVLSARSASAARGGEIMVNADTVDLTTGGQFLTTAFSSGEAGTITVNASDRLHIAGSDPTFAARLAQFGRPTVDPVSAASGLFTNTEANSSGAGGAIALTTNFLSLLNGGRLVASTAGQGNAGDIVVNSSNLRLSGASSGLFAQASSAANAGNLTIQPQGNGQSVTVQLQEGAQISASTAGSGRGGTLTIAAPESITLTGNGSIISAETSGSGTGGNLNLRTGTLTVQDGAEVTVSSSGRGRAGSLFVDANQIFLNNRGRIRADTSGGGGNINLRSPLILLRHGSNITTNATGGNIPGGNIAIDSRFLVAFPNEDSNISANSEDFRGGNVNINAFAIFGIQPRLQLTPLSDITATGASSALSGAIDVTTAGIDPNSGLVELPTTLVDSSGLIAQGCPAAQGNSFVISGRGGLPPMPEQQLDDDADWQDRRRLTVSQPINPRRDGSNQRPEGETHAPNTPVIEATRWQTTPTGEVILVATTVEPGVQNSLNQPVACEGRR